MNILRYFFRFFININIILSKFVDSFLPAQIREDGNTFFLQKILPRAFNPNTIIYDIGGGSQPCLDFENKQRLGIKLIGLDISAEELAAAPDNVYDNIIAADICIYTGDENADTVVCQALLEHVADTSSAIRAIASIVKPGGRVFLFVPSGNALFARLNTRLPEGIKRRLLFMLYPHKSQGHDGFEAHYNHCTPSQIEILSHQNSFEIEEFHLFWTSSYFMIFTPLFIVWRLYQLLVYPVLGKNGAETFAFILRKKYRSDSDV